MEGKSFEGKSAVVRIDPELEALCVASGFRDGGFMEIDEHCTNETLEAGIEETKDLLQVDEVRLVPTLTVSDELNYNRCIIFIRN